MAQRRSPDDWLDDGFAILGEEGLSALKLDRLCKRAGATKGSFYWHFPDMGAYRSALIAAWAQRHGSDGALYESIQDLPPADRLDRMVAGLLDPQHWQTERAMREWARSDQAVAAGVTEADRRVRSAVLAVFIGLGFDHDEAMLRASTTFAAGIGHLTLGGADNSPMTESQRKMFVEFMIRT